MLLPPIATLVDDYPTPDSTDSMELDTKQMDEDTRPPPLEGPSLGSSLGTLTTLFEFYQFERRWIHQQRSTLQDDPGVDPVCRESYEPSDVDEHSASSSSSSPSSGEPSKIALKAEPKETCISDPPKSRASNTLRFSRWPWSSRMRDPFELKPGARSSQHPGFNEPRLILPPVGHRTGFSTGVISSLVISETESPSDIAILDSFENMMEARLESCQRIDRLVRRAHGRKADIDQGGFTRSIGPGGKRTDFEPGLIVNTVQ
ncbi:hypothetical protein DFJ43DRAFT_1043336 [Lentinula guzmanii]|uniref:Uncharacterized protein n=1 Tax=Lentinula guzmanii TaxID=2804957 RepID=A0AA38J4D1_9AGAR|nr:hypothetical protein DFJ43DRAFT_1043336 [Lentinula guzmanii]